MPASTDADTPVDESIAVKSSQNLVTLNGLKLRIRTHTRSPSKTNSQAETNTLQRGMTHTYSQILRKLF